MEMGHQTELPVGSRAEREHLRWMFTLFDVNKVNLLLHLP